MHNIYQFNLKIFKMLLKRIKTIQFVISHCKYSQQQLTNKLPQALRSKKSKSNKTSIQNFVDLKHVRTIGGKGGDGCVSFLQLWSNENAGPDGGDGGNGAHVIFQTSSDIKDLYHIPTIIRAESGENGGNKDCNGKNATHTIIKIPIGSVVKNTEGKVVGDLDGENLMFVAARGGAGGKGNHFFVTDTNQAPNVCEFGAEGEDLEYILEIKTMAHVGLIGFPNAGKSTLLTAISRARPKIAPYPFTTIKPHLGTIQYDDYEQIAIADLPGLIPESHKNRGLGIQFLKHVERCMAILYVIDLTCENSCEYLDTLQFELAQFNKHLLDRPQIVVGNKIDLESAKDNLEILKSKTNLKVIGVSAKKGTNLIELLNEIRIVYDRTKENPDDDNIT